MPPPVHGKRRPPPILVPPAPPPRIVPGPNAFAIADQMKRSVSTNSLDAAGNVGPILTSLNPQHDPKQEDSHDRLSTATTTFTQLIELTRRSPRKSESHASSIASRHASTTRSRHSNKSGLGDTAMRLSKAENSNDEGKTSRAQIEMKAEKRFFKMMGQPLETDSEPGAEVAVFNRTREGRTDADTKSPKKRLFGMSLPGFRISNGSSTNAAGNTPAHTIPSKAAQLLGTTSPAKQHDPGQGRNARQPVRSDTSKSLPLKIAYDQHNHARRPNYRGSPRSNRRTTSSKTQSPEKLLLAEKKPNKKLGKPEDTSRTSGPPTPPAKDTPPALRDRTGQDHTNINCEAGPSTDRERSRSNDKALRIPDFLSPAPVLPAQGGESPTKFCPYTAEEYAQLIDCKSIASARVQFESAEAVHELDGGYGPARAEVDGKPLPEYPSWWNEDNQRRLAGKYSDQVLKPGFYSPSSFSVRLFEGSSPSKNLDERRLLFTVPVTKPTSPSHPTQSNPSNGSIEMLSQGEASEVYPTAPQTDKRDMANRQKPASDHEPTIQHPNEPLSNSRTARLPEHSSSRLTDILNGVSPSKSGFNGEFFANCPSALPSPLHQGQAQQAIHPAMMSAAMSNAPSLPGTLSDGSNILTHFFMCNEHMDVIGRTIFDLVVNQGNAQFALLNEKHKDLFDTLTERFEDLKANLEPVKQQVGDAADQNKAVNDRLDRLLEFIKAEIAEPLALQIKKNAEMEKDIEILKRGMQELKHSVQTPSSTQSQPSQGNQMGFAPALPNHRSQPSLAGYYEQNMETGRDGTRGPAIQEARNNGQYRYGNNSYGHAQSWVRTPASGLENKDRPYPLSNPYSSGPGQYGAGSSGGFYAGIPGYYAGHANEYSGGAK